MLKYIYCKKCIYSKIYTIAYSTHVADTVETITRWPGIDPRPSDIYDSQFSTKAGQNTD